MKSHGSIFSFNNLLAAAAVTVLLLPSACSEDPTAGNVLSGPMLRFEVVDRHGWQTPSQSRAAGDATDSTTLLHPDIFILRGGGEFPAADTLFLHATVADGIESDRSGAKEPQTRATPVEEDTFYESFGVLASAYTGSWSETSCLPDYMYNVEVTKSSGWTTNYFWPGGGREVRFFAYAPYGGSGVVLSAKTKAGAPTITYTVPEEVADQQDLLVAAPAAMDGTASAAASLPFEHVLTAVRFVTGDDVLAGKITKITLKGVYGSAVHTMGADLWRDYGTMADFAQSCSVDVDGSADQEITSAKATFMMLPQTLPAGASVEIAYRDDLTSTQRTLTALIGGAEWPMGKTVTYRISTTSISVVPTFKVTAPADFTYTGGSESYSVTSYVTVSRPGDATKTVAMAWSAEFVEEDGGGGYNVIARPDWLTDFTASDDGKQAVFTAAITAQQGVTSYPHNDLLQAAEPISGIYDLSTTGGTTPMNTANCYVINAPGIYSLPLVYGNAVKNGEPNPSAYSSSANGADILSDFVNHLDAAITDPYIYNNAGCTPKDAVLVWQDEKDLVTNVALALDGHNLTFEVPEASIRQGNAIVAVRDADGRIMWSWHIWVTDFVPGLDPTVEERYDPAKTQRDKVVINLQGVKYTFMGVNIGWCDAEVTIYDARSVKVRFTQAETGATQIITLTQASHKISTIGNNPYFQFGRKDPMLAGIPATSGSFVWTNKECYSDGYVFDESGVGKVAIGTSIQNPHMFYDYGSSSPYDWCANSYYNLWSADNTVTTVNDNAVVKTIYDPSPVGYHLPASNAFRGFTYDGWGYLSGFGTLFNSPYSSEVDFIDNCGWEFYCNKMNGKGNYDPAGGTIFFPFSGVRGSTGSVFDVGKNGCCWSAVPFSTDNGRSLFFHLEEAYINPLYTYSSHAEGCAVRPVRE